MPRGQLSVCIPTYNRALAVTALVQEVLACDEPGLRVVVLDNGSTDNTLVMLQALVDSRLSVHGNGVNRGVLFNVLGVFEKSQSDYSVLLLDKDNVDSKRLPDFIRFLLREKPACGYCEYDVGHAQERLLVGQGIAAVKRLGYLGHHPTGYFFDTALMNSLDFMNRFCDYEFVGHFPFDMMFAELAMKGDCAIYQRPVFTPESSQKAASHKSIGTNAAIEEAFFSPGGRLKMAINFSRHVRTLRLTESQKLGLIVDRFLAGILAGTFGYRAIMADPDLCAHYHLAPRRLGTRELLASARYFHRIFHREVIAPGRTGMLTSLRFHVRVLGVCWAKALRRLTKPS